MNNATEFDHEAAWTMAAKPLFESLSPEARALFDTVCEVGKDLVQSSKGSNYDLNWPEDGGALRQRFEALDDMTLAVLSKATCTYGHWSPEGTASTTNGGGWKCSNLADQVLQRRVGATSRSVTHGVEYKVTEGAIHVVVHTPWSTSGTTVALATAENMTTVKARIDAIATPVDKANRKTWDAYDTAVCAAAKRLCSALLPHGDSPLALVFNTASFMAPEGTWKKRYDDRRKALADTKHDVELVARAIVAIRLCDAAVQVAVGRPQDDLDVKLDHKIKLLFIQTGTSDDFNSRALARANELDVTLR